MAISVSGTMKPGGNFHIAEAEDILMPDGKRLSEFDLEAELPEITEADNGKILAVVNGKLVFITVEIPKELPDVTEEDNGKVLVAMNGEWTPVVVEIPNGVPDVTAEDNGKVLEVIDGTPQFVAVKDSAVAVYIDDYISSALEGDY